MGNYFFNSNCYFKNIPPPTNEIINMAILYSKSRVESKCVQLEYKRGNEEVRNKIFENLKSEILILSKNRFGNYVIQTILFYGGEEKISYIFDNIINDVVELSFNPYGCRVLQTLIEILGKIDKKDKIIIILKKLDMKGEIFMDQNGNHVIQKLINILDFTNIICIYEKVLENIDKLINNIYGSRIIQALLNKCDEEHAKKIIDKIFETHKNNLIDLCKSQFGNYIIQLILEKYNDNYTFESICKELKSNVYQFSLNKTGCYIIEKVLENGNNAQKNEIGKEIIEEDNKNKDCIITLVNDKYGNYVIQRAVAYCSEDIGKEINKRVKNIDEQKRGKYWNFVNNILD